MSEYIIMTDSCCDLSDEMAKELELNVVPLTVHLEGKDYPNYLDGSAISNAEFYGAIRAGKVASTSRPTSGSSRTPCAPCSTRARTSSACAFRPRSQRRTSRQPSRRTTCARTIPSGRSTSSTRSRPRWDRGFLLYLTVQQKRAGLSAKELADWVVLTA